jgi:hypothetical protein
MMGMENASETRALLSPLIHTRTADTRTFNVMLALNKDNKLPVEYSLRLYDTMLAVSHVRNHPPSTCLTAVVALFRSA